MSPVARTTDPETSHAAAASVGDVRLSQAAVLRCFMHFGPMTDETLVLIYSAQARSKGWPAQSPSGLRTRRSELVRKGLLKFTGNRSPISTGRLAREWGLPDD